MRILIYVLIIFLGALLGAKDILKERFMSKLSKLQFGSLLSLLFIMGVSIGVNDQILASFYKLGLQAFILALSSILFSILFVRVVSNYVTGERRRSKE